MNIWFIHAGGKIKQPFCLFKFGNRIYLLLRGGGALSKPLTWLEKEKDFFRRI
ncbi:hypothetical protein RN333_09545 [Enterobacter kobei]|jgi:hypothetical protein|uniref:hypothetical protein n=1 Tax=Enterobacter kobei TaxID=208224 RepID=UPI0013EAEC65|nr:hypothetical protein [Enterobacter kobei]WNP36407.1 hypothetical protein RN333_09545 [Enterobacter kobei]